MLAANAPDVDVLSYIGGPLFALSFRRGITHGWPALLVLPVVVAGAILAWDRWVRCRRDPQAEPVRAGPVLTLSAVGCATHPALDWMNTYGMRWSMPLDGSWTYGDALFIIDPWVWLTLGGSVFLASTPGRAALGGWAALGGLTTAFVAVGLPNGLGLWALGIVAVLVARAWRRPASREAGRSLVRAAAAAVAMYIGVLLALDGLAARRVLRVARAAGLQTRDVMVAPSPGNPFVSQVELVTDEGYVPGSHRWMGSPAVELFPERAVPFLSGPPAVSVEELQDLADRARLLPDVGYYLVWSRYPYFRVESDVNGWEVAVSDARYDGVAGAGGLSGLTVRLAETAGP